MKFRQEKCQPPYPPNPSRAPQLVRYVLGSRTRPIRLFRRKKSNTIVLTGQSGSGKTVLFYQLRDGSSHQGTVTSMEPNEGTFILHSETSKKGKIRPVHVIVVDTLDFLPNCRTASEYLYDILTNASVVKKKIPVLILCNKTDKVTAHTKEFIRKQLEKELDIEGIKKCNISS